MIGLMPSKRNEVAEVVKKWLSLGLFYPSFQLTLTRSRLKSSQLLVLDMILTEELGRMKRGILLDNPSPLGTSRPLWLSTIVFGH